MNVPTSLLRSRITIRSKSGEGPTGPVWDTTEGVPARVEGKRRQIRRPDGTDIVCSATVTVRPDVAVALGDEVVHDGRTYEVQDVNLIEGLTRTAGKEVLVA